MRKAQKKQIEEFLKVLEEAHRQIRISVEKKNISTALQVLGDCQQGGISLGNMLETLEKEQCAVIPLLEKYCEVVYQIHENLAAGESLKPDKIYKRLHTFLLKIENSIRNDIKVRREVVFLPYKASMWDSMESIWEAADRDPDCDTYVVPIPYYDKNPDGSPGNMHYEGELFPAEVPIVGYEAYDFKKRRPDVVYIHNPYDHCNYVTSIHPYFYSDQLKQFTEMLVYIPYCISGYTYHPEKMDVCRTPGIINSDIIILQSDSLKQVYIQHGIEEDKLLVMGNPKVDAVVNKCCYQEIPESWARKCAGRKCVLLNTSISTFLNTKEGVRNIRNMIQDITASREVFLIWRPHPLLKATVASMRPEQIEEYCELEAWITSSEDVEMDVSGDALTAIHFSDGLISDYSSLIFQYIFTEKPILSLTGKSSVKNAVIFCDYFASYFKREGISIEDFIKMLITGSDPNREERILRAKRLIVNTEGDCGKKVYDTIKRKLEGKESDI